MSGGFPKDQASLTSRSPASTGCVLEFSWKGPVQESTTKCLMNWIEHRLQQLDADPLLQKRIIRVCIELMQNLHHHAILNPQSSRFNVFTSTKNTWYIQTRNDVTWAEEESLKLNWNALKSIENEELRTLQRDKIAHLERSSHGGGGVGLNEIIRKSSGQVELEFITCSEQSSTAIFTAELPLQK